MSKATFGLQENIAAALSYVGFAVTGAIFYIAEPENKFVKFHALQSIIFFGGIVALKCVIGFLASILGIVPIAGWILALAAWVISQGLGLVGAVGWVYLIYSAFMGKRYEIPFIGKIVYAQVNK